MVVLEPPVPYGHFQAQRRENDCPRLRQQGRFQEIRELRENERKQSFVRRITRKRPADRSEMGQTVVYAQNRALPAMAHHTLLGKNRLEHTSRNKTTPK